MACCNPAPCARRTKLTFNPRARSGPINPSSNPRSRCFPPQNPMAHDHAHLFLKKPLKILIPGLLRGHYSVIHHSSVGWFGRLFKQTVSEHRPIKQHCFILTIQPEEVVAEKYPRNVYKPRNNLSRSVFAVRLCAVWAARRHRMGG